MRRLNSQFKTRFISEPGSDGLNSTYYGFVELDHYFCMVVAEGYDGEGGRESAKLAVDAAMEAFVQKPGMSSRRLKLCIKRASRCLTEQSVRIRLKAGILMVVSDYTRFCYAFCGNVMLYLLRNTMICHQSITHTVYQTMVEENKNGEDEPERETTNLIHYLGGDGKCTVSGKMKLAEEDVLLVVTESFWSRVSRVEVLDAFESIKSEDEFLGDLQELFIRGSADYVPCCCLAAVNIKKTYKENTKLKKKILIWILVIVLIAGLAGIIFSIYRKNKRVKQQEIRSQTQIYEDTGDRYIKEFSCTLAKQEYEKALESGKRLSASEERMGREQELSDKINLSAVLDGAEKAWEDRNYTQARAEYKKALNLVKAQPDLSVLSTYINQRLKLAGTGMEIDNYIQSGVLKEAEGELEAAGILYDQAEAMLRIVDNPELLQQVQLAKLRVKGQSREEGKEERARERDQVIIDADKTAAVDALLAEDYETAIALYTKIRDSYIALEENEKAEETTAVILSLQKRAREAGDPEAAAIEEERAAALEAVMDGDIDKALELYEKIRFMYLAMGQLEKADEIQNMIDSLNKDDFKAVSGESGDSQTQKGPGETGAPGGTESKGKESENTGKTGQNPGPGEISGGGQTTGAGGEVYGGQIPGSGEETYSQAPGSGEGAASARYAGPGEGTFGGSDPGPGAPVSPARTRAALQEAALRSVAGGDLDWAIELYQHIKQSYENSGNPDMADMAEETIAQLRSLQREAGGPGGGSDG